MSRETMVAYMSDQLREIEIHKWIESEKAGFDLGDTAVRAWILAYAAPFRAWWYSCHEVV